MNDEFVLGYLQKESLTLSNDAFFYIYSEDEMLDESNMAEVNELYEKFPNGFEIDPEYTELPESGQIQCSIIPYIKLELHDYDEYSQFTKYIQLQIKWIDKDHLQLWYFNKQKGTQEYKGEFEVFTDKFGNRCFVTGNKPREYDPKKGALFFLQDFTKKNRAQ